jgi:hypothetical protein
MKKNIIIFYFFLIIFFGKIKTMIEEDVIYEKITFLDKLKIAKYHILFSTISFVTISYIHYTSSLGSDYWSKETFFNQWYKNPLSINLIGGLYVFIGTFEYLIKGQKNELEKKSFEIRRDKKEVLSNNYLDETRRLKIVKEELVINMLDMNKRYMNYFKEYKTIDNCYSVGSKFIILPFLFYVLFFLINYSFGSNQDKSLIWVSFIYLHYFILDLRKIIFLFVFGNYNHKELPL